MKYCVEPDPECGSEQWRKTEWSKSPYKFAWMLRLVPKSQWGEWEDPAKINNPEASLELCQGLAGQQMKTLSGAVPFWLEIYCLVPLRWESSSPKSAALWKSSKQTDSPLTLF